MLSDLAAAPGMGLLDLPIELLQHIALEISSDKDVCSFAAACRNSRDAIYHDGDSFWFQRFRVVYDPVFRGDRMINNSKYRELYQKRHRSMAKALSVKQISKRCNSRSKWSKNYLQVLIELIEDAAPTYENADGEMLSRNADLVAKHAFQTGLLNEVLRVYRNSTGSETLKTIQLLLAHTMFPLFGRAQKPHVDAHNFAESQRVVYASEFGNENKPVFRDPGKQQVNIDFALHCANFFKHHLTHEPDRTGYPEYSALPVNKRPAPWQPQAEADVGKLAYLEHRELSRIRTHPKRDDMIFQDKHIDEGQNVLQNMDIDFVNDDADHFYPELFDMILNPNKYSGGQAQHRLKPIGCGDQKIRFTGLGEDEETFATTGYLTPLPPQNGVPGFCRIVMMKYFYLEDDITVATDSLWAYEGVVLPGGKIMVGRWWAADAGTRAAEMYSGPFIFWNVPDEPVRPQVSLIAPATQAQGSGINAASALFPGGGNIDLPDEASDPAETLASEEDVEEDTVHSDEKASENRLERLFNSLPEDMFEGRINNGTVAGHTPAAKTPKTPTTPFLGMSLGNPIDLTESPDEVDTRGTHNALGFFSTLERVDSPIRSASRSIDSSTEAIWATLPKSYYDSSSHSSIFSSNAPDHLAITTFANNGGHEHERPYLSSGLTHDLTTETRLNSDKFIGTKEKGKYTASVKKSLGHGGTSMFSQDGKKAIRRP